MTVKQNCNMKAKYTTSCISCGEQITRGKEIVKNNSGSWVHKHCATEATELP